MTGFGRAESQLGPVAYHVEVRSVNHKFLKVMTKLSDPLSFFESDVEGVVKRHLARGTVYVTIDCQSVSTEPEYEFNLDALRSYHAALRKIHRDLGSDDQVPILELVNLPGVLQRTSDSIAESDGLRELLTQLLERALAELQTMREAEGAALKRDVEARCERLREFLDVVRQRAPIAVDEYRQRLTERITEMLKPTGAKVDGQDFYREVAIFAERSDVAEELARLESHVEQLLAAMEDAEPVGRKLEFISQEMFREANTMASKANDAELVRVMVDVKGEVDRIREQIQNVE